MNDQLDAAMKSGKIQQGATPDQIYQSVIAPWLKSKDASLDVGATDHTGQKFSNTLTGAVQALIGSWQQQNGVPAGFAPPQQQPSTPFPQFSNTGGSAFRPIRGH